MSDTTLPCEVVRQALRVGGWRKTAPLNPLCGRGLETGGRDRKATVCRIRYGNSAPPLNENTSKKEA
ncbi:MAG: hypothetical protein LBK25_07275 [Treponema sp.]|nr:hypothetical protein [Treponema sp.]